MIIDLRKILGETRHFEFFLDQDSLQRDNRIDPGFKIERPFSVKAELYKAGDKYILEGGFQGKIQISCDRCLEPFPHELNIRLRRVLVPSAQDTEDADKELIEQDLNIDMITADIIDLADIVKEQIYLYLPMKKICKTDCQGLCPGCGMNLNLGKCSCQPNHGHPGFQKLKTLKIQ